jgi:hypothetical protein
MRDTFDLRCQRLRGNGATVTAFFDNDNVPPHVLIDVPVKHGPYELGKMYRVTIEQLKD